jgi:heptosyltransferase-2
LLHSVMVTPKELDQLVQVDDTRSSDQNIADDSGIKKNAVLMPNWISEFILALSVVTRKAADSNHEITLIVPEHLIPLCRVLSALPTIPYSRKNSLHFLDSAAIVKEAAFDKLYLLPHSFSSAWFGYKTGVSCCRGVGAEQRNQFLTESVPLDIVTKEDHLTKEYSIVLETEYLEPSSWPGISIDRHEHFFGSVVLCPGSGEITRRWTGFEELVKLWPDQHFYVIGDENDVEASINVGRRLPHRVVNLTGKTSLDEAVAIISAASVVISNDSGLMQIAGFVGTPVVGVFGGSSPLWRRPLGEAVRVVVSSDSPCRYCFKRECAKKNYQCMSTILPENVIRAAMEIMRQQ